MNGVDGKPLLASQKLAELNVKHLKFNRVNKVFIRFLLKVNEYLVVTLFKRGSSVKALKILLKY